MSPQSRISGARGTRFVEPRNPQFLYIIPLKYTAEYASDRILKISQNLEKLFWTTRYVIDPWHAYSSGLLSVLVILVPSTNSNVLTYFFTQGLAAKVGACRTLHFLPFLSFISPLFPFPSLHSPPSLRSRPLKSSWTS